MPVSNGMPKKAMSKEFPGITSSVSGIKCVKGEKQAPNGKWPKVAMPEKIESAVGSPSPPKASSAALASRISAERRGNGTEPL